MRPGQIESNEFELAILTRIADDEPSIRGFLGCLRVLSREYTGVGSFTTFRCDEPGPTSHLGLNALISMPQVPNGMGAVLWCKGGRPSCLETYTYGTEPWDGDFAGFSIDEAAQQPREQDARQHARPKS